MYLTLGRAELAAPSAAQGAFIPAGNAFDALAAFSSIFSTAESSILLVDPYMDEKALSLFALMAPENVDIRLLSDQGSYKANLKPAVIAWTAQYSFNRPLEARLAQAKSLHDRLAIVDERTVYILTQSLNAFATRSPASIVRVEDEPASLKLTAYKDIWDHASPI